MKPSTPTQRLAAHIAAALTLLSSVLLPPPILAEDSRAASVDLTPTPTKRSVEGATLESVYFRAGSARIEYMPPWPVLGQPDRAQLSIPVAGAQADIRRVVTGSPLDFGNDTAVTEFLLKQLPKDAESVEVAPLQRNPLRIDGKESAELLASYVCFGRRLQLSTLISQRVPGSEVYLFQVSSAPGDFKKIHRIFQSSLYTIAGF